MSAIPFTDAGVEYVTSDPGGFAADHVEPETQ